MQKKPPMPAGYARLEGRKDARKMPPVLVGTADGEAWVDQHPAEGVVIEVYNGISWAPYEVTPRDYMDYVAGFEEMLAEQLGFPVWLQFVTGRGNGHDDYRIVRRPAVGETWRHVKRGSVYEVEGTATLQCSGTRDVDDAPLVLYRAADEAGPKGRRWARPLAEFLDGRFERVEAASV